VDLDLCVVGQRWGAFESDWVARTNVNTESWDPSESYEGLDASYHRIITYIYMVFVFCAYLVCVRFTQHQ
jgi:hypothetical protein